MNSHPTTPAHEVYLLITIDTECDHDNNWARSLPLTYTIGHRRYSRCAATHFQPVDCGAYLPVDSRGDGKRRMRGEPAEYCRERMNWEPIYMPVSLNRKSTTMTMQGWIVRISNVTMRRRWSIRN